eukprot:Blabericola_migrator_1__4373@NODE_234_length_11037_cov_77_854421_g199_i0_p4_GENE_NODE_234_length_11037_cov_77_854421_g199_i0NODE_234_length_11037_cov_77_854421_g199_i0_p4_ORF_typecomplete_len577_score130_79MiaE/PF06175_11/0_12MiaE/PF06175_11/1_3e04DUF3853/PF12964_7/2_8e03DUF3853/PF12964_7/0_86DUF3853/PF12964_7/5_8e03EcoR124_C/PF12008_8/0_84EcoR124_C/PF12008_8/1_3e03EcoR124_C/PF12008_8/4_8e03DUF2624/PF11116_8/9_2DUF2624/PF11116_8/2e02DUF2624/PF11116_8/1_5e04DUF2624/PF11116_8/1_9e03_NODE_234_lengt
MVTQSVVFSSKASNGHANLLAAGSFSALVAPLSSAQPPAADFSIEDVTNIVEKADLKAKCRLLNGMVTGNHLTRPPRNIIRALEYASTVGRDRKKNLLTAHHSDIVKVHQQIINAYMEVITALDNGAAAQQYNLPVSQHRLIKDAIVDAVTANLQEISGTKRLETLLGVESDMTVDSVKKDYKAFLNQCMVRAAEKQNNVYETVTVFRSASETAALRKLAACKKAIVELEHDKELLSLLRQHNHKIRKEDKKKYIGGMSEIAKFANKHLDTLLKHAIINLPTNAKEEAEAIPINQLDGYKGLATLATRVERLKKAKTRRDRGYAPLRLATKAIQATMAASGSSDKLLQNIQAVAPQGKSYAVDFTNYIKGVVNNNIKNAVASNTDIIEELRSMVPTAVAPRNVITTALAKAEIVRNNANSPVTANCVERLAMNCYDALVYYIKSGRVDPNTGLVNVSGLSTVNVANSKTSLVVEPLSTAQNDEYARYMSNAVQAQVIKALKNIVGRASLTPQDPAAHKIIAHLSNIVRAVDEPQAYDFVSTYTPSKEHLKAASTSVETPSFDHNRMMSESLAAQGA